MSDQFIPDAYIGRLPSTRPSSTPSISSSSLAGAMGDNISSQTRSHRLSHQENMSYPLPNQWTSSPPMHASQQMHLPNQIPYTDPVGNMFFQNLPPNDLTSFHVAGHRTPSTDSLSSGEHQYGVSPEMPSSVLPLSRHRSGSNDSEDTLRAEIHHLRRKVRHFEAEYSKARAALDAATRFANVPEPLGFPLPPHSSDFRASWKARTEARKRIFCSFNRAGNALCAWHDSRRERRAFPPRNAPPGYLNCGCTHEEALFEESLARHGVGSYHPGENVRMDPALRNPLLKLLKKRYGYQDGDFERDPNNGEWVEGEGPVYWEQQANAGSSGRKLRPEV